MSCNRCNAPTTRRLCSECELEQRNDDPIAPEVFEEDEGDADE